MTELEQANATILAVEKLRGLPRSPLGPGNQIAFGTLMFRFDPNEKTLMVAILISQNQLWNQINPDFAQNTLKTMAAYADPAIGGMFDSGGGKWVFERKTGSLLLYRSYPPAAPAAGINADLERMIRVAPEWGTSWGLAVAAIAHGREAPPATRVTLENNPYAGRL